MIKYSQKDSLALNSSFILKSVVFLFPLVRTFKVFSLQFSFFFFFFKGLFIYLTEGVGENKHKQGE